GRWVRGHFGRGLGTRAALARAVPSRRTAATPALAIARLLSRDRLHACPDPGRVATQPAEQSCLGLLQDLVLDLVVVHAELVQRSVERVGNRRACRLHPLHRSASCQRLRFFLLVRRPAVPGRAPDELVVVVGFFAVDDAGLAGAVFGTSPGGGGSWKIDRSPPPLLVGGTTALAPFPGADLAGGFAEVLGFAAAGFAPVEPAFAA